MLTAEGERAAAELLTVGFQGRELNDTLRRHLDRGVSGVVLFSRNLGTRAEVADLIRTIKVYAARPVFVAVDQEGGVVQRLRDGFTRIPPMRVLGETGDSELAWRVGNLVGRELRAVGVDVNFAPVLDVDTNPQNPVIGNRSFSREAPVVARLGVAYARGLQAAGVASCGKHFPGHGDTSQDSHQELPRLEHTLQRLRAVELEPFHAWSKAGLASVMTAHVIFGALDGEHPATLSPHVLRDLLRGELGYRGLVFSDDLEMKAIADHYGYEEAAILGVRAGVDNFLCCHTESVAVTFIEAVARALEDGRLSQQDLEGAQSRVTHFRETWAGPSHRAQFAAGGLFPGSIGARSEESYAEEGALLVEEIERRAGVPISEGADPTEARAEGTDPSQREQAQQ
jgi:beta-N-acetylhexosaminidase